MALRRRHFGYKPPGIDSARAKAGATLFLLGVRTIESLTAEAFAHQYRLKPKTAAAMLNQEKERRATQ